MNYANALGLIAKHDSRKMVETVANYAMKKGHPAGYILIEMTAGNNRNDRVYKSIAAIHEGILQRKKYGLCIFESSSVITFCETLLIMNIIRDHRFKIIHEKNTKLKC